MQQKRCVRSPLGAAESYLIFERPKKNPPYKKQISPPKGGDVDTHHPTVVGVHLVRYMSEPA